MLFEVLWIVLASSYEERPKGKREGYRGFYIECVKDRDDVE